MCERELGFYQTIKKLSERLHVINYHVQSGMQISESDIALLRKLFPLWYRGEIIFHEFAIDEKNNGSSQQKLFTDTKTDK